MKKHRFYLLFTILFSIGWLGVIYKYSTKTPKDERKFITVKITESPLNKRHFRSRSSDLRIGRKANSLKNKMRALGIPIYVDEVVPQYTGESNGVEDLQRSFELMDSLMKTDLQKLFNNRDELTDQQVSEMLQEGIVLEILEHALKASKKDFIDFNLNYEEGPGLLLPHLGSMRNLLKLISLHSAELTNKGNVQQAVESLNTGIRLNSLANDSATLISELVAVAGNKILDENIENLREAGADLSDTYSLLENELNTSLDGQLNSLDGERLLMGDWVFNKILNNELKGEEIKALMGNSNDYFSELSPNDLQKDYAEYLERMVEVRLLMEEPYYVNHGKFQESIEKTATSPITSMIMPAFSKIYKKYNEHQSSLKMNLLTIKLDQFKEESGRLPDTLSELRVPQDYLVDNISGTPFVLDSTNGKARILRSSIIQ